MTAAMTETDVLGALKDASAILDGHFRLTSGRHSGRYVQCARVLEDPALTTRLAETIAERIGERRVDLVASPAIGGIIIGFAVAQALGVRFIFSERTDGEMRFRRGFEVPENARVLVVEDVITTGGSAAEVVELVQAEGAEVIGVASIIDRGGPKAFDIESMPLLRLEVESWDPSECALCASGESIDSPGSRHPSA